MEKITRGNIILIYLDDTEPSLSIIPKVDFQTCTIKDIFRKINNLTNQFPNCNFKNCSFLYENKYKLPRSLPNITLSKWFHTKKIQKDDNNNYIFYIKKRNNHHKTNNKRGKTQQKQNQRFSRRKEK